MKKTLYTLFTALLTPLFIYAQAPADVREYEGMKLVWHDEFDKPGAPDSTRWQFEHGFVRNHELQWYQPQNARVTDGVLQITGRRERVRNPRYQAGSRDWRRNQEFAEYTSSCVESRGRFDFLYGRLEVRARIPIASGSWPAIWTLGNQGVWPAGGEVDVMEFYRVPPATMGIHHDQASRQRTMPIILANACWQGADGRDAWDTQRVPFTHFTDRDPDWASKFHVWRMDWTPESIRLYLDDELLNEIEATQAAPARPGPGLRPYGRGRGTAEIRKKRLCGAADRQARLFRGPLLPEVRGGGDPGGGPAGAGGARRVLRRIGPDGETETPGDGRAGEGHGQTEGDGKAEGHQKAGPEESFEAGGQHFRS